MYGSIQQRLEKELQETREAGLYKEERIIIMQIKVPTSS